MADRWSVGEVATAANMNRRMWDGVAQVSTSTGNTLTSGSSAVISWETEVLDPLGWFDAGAPTLFTPTINGYYRIGIRGAVGADPDADFTLFQIRVQKNGTDVYIYTGRPAAIASVAPSFFGTTPLLSMNGSSDTARILAAQTNTDADSYTFTGFYDIELVRATT